MPNQTTGLTASALHRRWELQEEQQEAVNRLAREGNYEGARALALQLADEAHAAYPQYEGYWDDWELGRMPSRAQGKAGVQFEEGDYVLCSLDTGVFGDRWTWRAYSLRLGWNCEVARVQEL